MDNISHTSSLSNNISTLPADSLYETFSSPITDLTAITCFFSGIAILDVYKRQFPHIVNERGQDEPDRDGNQAHKGEQEGIPYGFYKGRVMHDLLVILEAYEFILAEAKDLDVMKAVLDGSQHRYVGQHNQGNDADEYKGIPHKLLFYL